MTVTRIPLVEGLEGRSFSLEEDGLASNVFYDKEGETTYASKRPGIVSYISGSGQAQGIYAYGDDLFSWETRSYTWRDLIFHVDRFVIIRSDGQVGPTAAVSSTGLSWIESDSQLDSVGSNILASNGSIITAPSGTHLLTSNNGLSWAVSAKPFLSGNSISYGVGLFVIFSGGSSFQTSPDGLTYTNRSDSDLSFSTTSVSSFFANGRFVVGGKFTGGINSGATSTDGLTYSAITFGAGSARVTDIAFGGGRWIAVTGTTTYYHSTDGINWTVATLSIAQSRIAYNGTHFLAINGSSSSYLSSSDGLSWESSPNPLGTGVLIAADTSVGAFMVAGGSVFSSIARSAYSVDNGFSWYKADLPSVLIRTVTPL